MRTLRLSRNLASLFTMLATVSAFVAVPAQASADTWRGTAPFCDGQCLTGEAQIGTSDSGDGGYCVTGHKVLCRNNQPMCASKQTKIECYALVEVCDNGFYEVPTKNWHSCAKFACGVCFGKSNAESSSPAIESSTGSSAQAVKASLELARFAAIWEKRPSAEWVARHGMTSSQYQEEFIKFTKKGYRLTNVNGYGVNGQDYYAAIWEKNSGLAWMARHGMSSAQYQEEFDKLAKQGYRLVDISGYNVGGQDHYAAIWEKSSGLAWVARHGMTSAQYQEEFDKLAKQGYRLVAVSGYDIGGQDHYAAIWEKSAGPAWVARHGMTSAQYQDEFKKLAGQGYRLVRVSGWGVDGKSHYAAIWQKSSGSAWVARHGMTSAQYQKEFEQLVKDGYRLTEMSGY